MSDESMRAVVVSGFGAGEARVAEVKAPQAAAGLVVIQAVRAGVNYADHLDVSGDSHELPRLPFVPGREAAGYVLEVGEGVSGLARGDRVLAQVPHGAFAERLRARASSCHRLPDGLDFETAVALGLTYQTAWFALIDRAGLMGGERVLITGASGGVGLAALQFTKARGAMAMAGVRSDTQAAFVREQGADRVVRLDVDNLEANLREQVQDATNGHGADVIIEPVGGNVFDASLKALAWRGRIVVVGFAAGRIPTVRAGDLLTHNITLSGLHLSEYRERDPEWVRRAQADIFDLYGKGKLKPLVSVDYPLEEFDAALEAVRAGGQQGKVLLALPDRPPERDPGVAPAESGK